MKNLQYLLIKQLLQRGTVELLLPNGIVLEIGITQEDQHGRRIISDDYCYVFASKDKKSTLLDSYNVSMMFDEEPNTILYEDSTVDEEGDLIKSFEVI